MAGKHQKKTENSVKFCLLCFGFGVLNVAVYWIAVFLRLNPDATVACTGMVEMIAPVIGYFIYQAKLKDSRNKYRVDANGVPYDLSEETTEETEDV